MTQQADFTVEPRTALTLRLPFPPSVNRYWRMFTPPGQKRPRIIISEEGRNYRLDAVAAVLSDIGTLKPMGGRLAVLIDVHAPDARIRDLDNLCKSLLDAMKHCRVYEDDSQIDRLAIVRGLLSRPSGFVNVTVNQL